MYSELERNIPGHANWEGSFYERLSEYGEWDSETFWVLHSELLDIAKKQDLHSPVIRELAYMLLYIQQRVLNLISAHFAENDFFEISNIDTEQLYEFRERFEMAILGTITGKVLPETSFDLVNPLINNA
ncbi:immunity 41 family protein [Vibrio sp. Of14-4]|uniref:Imm41 family immunity protein n=1 Tax=Vibrio sp. Of14-4 TaxID=2724878 RepID=UPI001EF1B789|nr:Imm41 family immunity protein [Vibrio sp. Of14-4]MCG7490195.1 immunity 41 family protein [Vibrio sp. Of14-4]